MLLAAAGALYEETPTASMAIREALWRQMAAWAGAPGELYAKPRAPRLERIGEDEIATYYRTWIEVAKGLDQYGLYLVPKAAKGKRPLVIAMHGGGGTPEMALFQGGANYKDLVRGAAREGYVVYAPLAVQWPFGDRDRGTAIPKDARDQLDTKLKARGTTLRALEIAKLRRALEALLAARGREVDGRRIAMIGLSFGAAMTVHTMAAEPRIRAGVASCLPRMKTDLPAEWPARALQVQMGVSDPLIPIAEPREVLAQGKPATLEYREFEGKHEFHGALAWEFLRKNL